MSKANNILFSVLGWEDRAKKGFIHNFEKEPFSRVILVSYTEYEKYTKEHTSAVIAFCKEKKIQYQIIELSYSNNIASWHTLVKFFEANSFFGYTITLDISTIPRDLLWLFLYFFKQSLKSIKYVYYKPLNYNKEWLSKDPSNPRLLLKHSGISKLDIDIALVIISGFDTERIRHLIDFYEPTVVYLGIQQGTQFENDIRNNIDIHLNDYKGYYEINQFSIDSYSPDNGFEAVSNVIKKVKNYNIIISSLGPKPSSLALYKCYMDNPEIALAYVPCVEYNIKYSSGIGQRLDGLFTFSQ